MTPKLESGESRAGNQLRHRGGLRFACANGGLAVDRERMPRQ